MLSKNHLNSASKTNACRLISVNIIALASPLHVFFPILPRGEIVARKKGSKRNQRSTSKSHHGLLNLFFSGNSVCSASTADCLC